METPLDPSLRERILARLGIEAPAIDAPGLDALYRAWCRNIPFDNGRKRLALVRGDPAPLPGGEPDAFFRFWLEHGGSGTCWPTSNALHALLAACGFDARRVSASMFDNGTHNHGSVIVRLGGRDLLVDSSMLAEVALELKPNKDFDTCHSLYRVIGEHQEAGWLVSFPSPHSGELMPCRLLADPVSEAFYLERYEASRQESPFNAFLYARRNADNRTVLFLGRKRIVRTAHGIEQQELQGAALEAALVDDLGYSSRFVEELLRADAL